MSTHEFQQLSVVTEERFTEFKTGFQAGPAKKRACQDAARQAVGELISNHYKPKKGEAAQPWENFLKDVTDHASSRGVRAFANYGELDLREKVELSTIVALNVLRGNRAWPPPQQLVELIAGRVDFLVAEARRRCQKKTPDEKATKSDKLKREILNITIQQPHLRVPEVVFTTLLGCIPRSLAPRDAEAERLVKAWVGDDTDLRLLLRDMILISVCAAFSMVRTAFQRFDPLSQADPLHYANGLMLTFMSRPGQIGGCQCAASVHGSAVGVELRGNARIKQLTCQRQHSARVWDPWSMTFWMHERRFVVGSCRAAQFGALPTGALYSLLQRDTGLLQANLAHFQCPSCNAWTWHSRSQCGKCGHQMPGNVRVEVRKALILTQGDLFVARLCWICRSDQCRDAKGRGHVYTADRCGKCQCRSKAENCDCCDRCSAPHPKGRAQKLTLVYFFKGDTAMQARNFMATGGGGAAPPAGSSPAIHAITLDEVHEIEDQIVAGLPVEQREVWEKYREFQEDPDEISAETGVPIADVYAIIDSVLAEIRDRLGGNPENGE